MSENKSDSQQPSEIEFTPPVPVTVKDTGRLSAGVSVLVLLMTLPVCLLALAGRALPDSGVYALGQGMLTLYLLAMSVVIAVRWWFPPEGYLMPVRHRPLRALGWGVCAGFTCFAIQWVMSVGMAVARGMMGKEQIDHAHSAFEQLDKVPLEALPLYILTWSLMPVLIIPLLEEMAFRGALMEALLSVCRGLRRQWFVAGLLNSIVFVTMHAFVVTQFEMIPILLVVALVWVWVRRKTGQWWPCVVAHALFNGCNVVIYVIGRLMH